MPSRPLEFADGISAPDRNIWGNTSSTTPSPATLGSWTKPMNRMPSAPPAIARIGASMSTRIRSPGSIGICITTIIASTPMSEIIAATAAPSILPIRTV